MESLTTISNDDLLKMLVSMNKRIKTLETELLMIKKSLS